MNNFCLGVKYKIEIDSKLKFQSLICTLNRKIIYLALIFFDKKSIKTHLYSCFYSIIQTKFIFNTFSLIMLESLFLNLNFSKRIEKHIFSKIFVNILVNLILYSVHTSSKEVMRY
jgi:hypothetical protein